MKTTISIIATLLFGTNLIAQSIGPDPSFGNGGAANHLLAKGNERIFCTQALSDGASIAGGTILNKDQDFFLTKILSSGLRDNTFGNNGFVSIDNQEGTETINSLALRPDGKILAVGSSQRNGITRGMVFRFNSNGSPDTSFGTGGLFEYQLISGSTYTFISAIKLLTDGKFLLSGSCLSGTKYKAFAQKRNEDGSLDSAFGTSGSTLISYTTDNYSLGTDLAIAADGCILIYGQAYTTKYLLGIAKLSSAGLLDVSFSGDGLATSSPFTSQSYPTRIFALPSGKLRIIAYGYNTNSFEKISAAGFKANGTADSSFGTNGIAQYSGSSSYNGAYAAELLDDGSFLIGGEIYLAGKYQASVLKINASGSPVSSFGTAGFATFNASPVENFCNAIAISGGRILMIGGQYQEQDNSIVSFAFGINASTSTLDQGFANGGRAFFKESKASTRPGCLIKTADGKYLATGTLENFNSDLFISRFNSNGSLDQTFENQGLGIQNFNGPDIFKSQISLGNGKEMVLLSSGSQSITFGTLGTFTGSQEYGLYSYNPLQGSSSGTLATGTVSTGEFQVPVAATLDHKGRVIVAIKGQQPTKNTGYLVRWNAEASAVDASFGTSGKRTMYSNMFNSEQEIRDIEGDSEGNLFVLQYIKLVSATNGGLYLSKRDSNFTLVNSFGTFGQCEIIDNSQNLFNPSSMFLNNGQIMVLGSKSGIKTIARISAEGQLQGFISLPEFKFVSKVIFIADGSAIILGTGSDDFIRIVRVLADGSIDGTFNDNGVFAGNFFGGKSTLVDAIMEGTGTSFTILAETTGESGGSWLSLLKINVITGNEVKIEMLENSPVLYPNPAKEKLFWKNDRTGYFRLSIFDKNARQIGSETISTADLGMDLAGLPAGTYYLKMSNEKETITLPFFKE